MTQSNWNRNKNCHPSTDMTDCGLWAVLWTFGRKTPILAVKDEKAFIREAVEIRGLPFLGLCVGHQNYWPKALGGSVSPSEIPEIGVMDVRITEEGASGVILDGLPDRFPCLQWHSAEVK